VGSRRRDGCDLPRSSSEASRPSCGRPAFRGVLGIVLIPLIGNVAEHLVAVSTARKNRMELSLAISLGSSQQIALFVAPLLVFVSLLFGNEMTLFFNPFEVVVLALSVLIAGQVAADGESNWLEGAQLLVVYAIVAMAFLWL
jgi:Ca2+:H+ antiporter